MVTLLHSPRPHASAWLFALTSQGRDHFSSRPPPRFRKLSSVINGPRCSLPRARARASAHAFPHVLTSFPSRAGFYWTKQSDSNRHVLMFTYLQISGGIPCLLPNSFKKPDAHYKRLYQKGQQPEYPLFFILQRGREVFNRQHHGKQPVFNQSSSFMHVTSFQQRQET